MRDHMKEESKSRLEDMYRDCAVQLSLKSRVLYNPELHQDLFWAACSQV